jgi:hypothetical protein
MRIFTGNNQKLYGTLVTPVEGFNSNPTGFEPENISF